MSKQPNYVFDDELYHHGILGQRWGHRRFQNEDGSWTPEGRERYSEGDERSKAKISYNTQKYKADLKSKARQDKDVRAAKEERNRIKQQAKTDKLARREQNKLDRKQARLDKKLANEQTKAKDDVSLKNKLVRTKRYAMSDDELSKAIDRLKLEVEYNKQYALAAKPNGALARADRFFDGPTGKAFTQVAVATLPKVAETATKSILDNKLKYANKLDRDKQLAEIESKQAETKNKLAGVKSTEAKTAEQKADTIRKDAESQAKIESGRRTDDRLDRESEAGIKLNRSAQAASTWQTRQEQNRLNNKANLENKVKEAEEFGYDPGNRLTRSANYVSGRLAWRYGNNGEIAKEQEAKQKENAEKLANAQSERKIKEENAALDRDIKKAEAQTRINEVDRIQRNIEYMTQNNIPGSAEYARNASGALRATINIMSNPEVHNKPASSLASLPSITSGTESRIKSLRSSGKTLREIAKTMNMPTSTVASVFYDIKI